VGGRERQRLRLILISKILVFFFIRKRNIDENSRETREKKKRVV
jgi:hypothetical protein